MATGSGRAKYKQYNSEDCKIPRTTLWRMKKHQSAGNAKRVSDKVILTDEDDLTTESDNTEELAVEEDESHEVGDYNEPENERLEEENPLFLEVEEEEELGDADQPPGEQPIYEGSTLTLNQSMMLIMTFALKHGLSGLCLADLLTLISLHCLTPNICRTSLYLFRKYFADIHMPLVFHKYCSNCLHNFTGDLHLCPLCTTDLTKSKSVSYFVEIPMAQQLVKMFRRKDFHTDICHRFSRRNQSHGNIEDIYDGHLYKNQSLPGNILSFHNNISLMWYTDGVALYKSSKFSIWPLFFSINELPYSKRMKTENLLFGGLWFGDVKPPMEMFLKPFCQTLEAMKTEGVKVDCKHCDSSLIVKVCLLCGTCDLPARSLVFNMNQFNGKHSCSRCKQEGKVVKAGKGHTRVFPFQREDPYGPSRTHDEMVVNGREAGVSGETICGVKGQTWISRVQPDIIRGMAVDYMHCVLLGIVRRLMTLWFATQNKAELFSFYKHVDTVDRRLLSIKPPNFISRIPRSVKEHASYWKANECRAWLLYYSIPVLYGILTEEYFQHYMLLVEAIYLLSCESISQSMLDKSNALLTYFVCMYEVHYGERHMSANLHQLLHLPEVVKDLGPLWVYSCFSFEDINGQLVKLFHGTQHPQIQIATAVSTVLHMPEISETFDINSAAGQFHDRLKKSSNIIPKCTITFEGFGIVGKRVLRKLSHEQHILLTSILGKEPTEILFFFRMYKDGKTFQSLQYTAVEERNSYTVIYFDGIMTRKYGHVEKYIEVHSECEGNCVEKCDCPPKYFAVIKDLAMSENPLKNGYLDDPPKNIVLVNPSYSQYSIVPISNIMDLCVYVRLLDCENTAFVCKPPNSVEND